MIDTQTQETKALDLTERIVIAKFNEVSNSTTLTVAAVKDAKTITVANTTGFVDGKYIILFDPSSKNFSFYTQVGAVAGNVVPLDTPLDFSYPIGTFVDAAITNMNVDGSSTTRTFGLRGTGTPPGVKITAHITRIVFHCITTTAVDLSKFGNITSLENGLVLRKRDGTISSIFNVKNNGELAGILFDWEPRQSINPNQGVDGFVARLTFAGMDKMGAAVELPLGEDLEFIIQDDLSSGVPDITLFEVVAEGHIIRD